MSTVPTLAERFRNVIIPTRSQVLGSCTVALIILVPTQSRALLSRLGLPPAIVAASQTKFHTSFDTILNAPVVSQFALITFWAAVGLVTYLICWGAYNVLIEARNEVTLKTAYTNRGHEHSPYRLLAFKAVSALALALTIGSLRFGLALWIALAARFADQPAVTTAGWLALGVAGLALELYLVLIFIQLTFTPWYSAVDVEETFTEQ